MKKKIIIWGLVLFASSILTGCKNHGTEKTINGVQYFYTSNVTETELYELADALKIFGFEVTNDDEGKTVQLNKTGDTYEIRAVIKKGLELDDEFCDMAKKIAKYVSHNVFDDAYVEFHLCDEHLETVRVLLMSNYN
ncbi:MAG: hypothetical protein LBC68_02540 [Prevotellaceae bacterium]|jgi:predicted small secreted protein|nr:hypothetical protein [Prevotellaceae bacterium]